MWCTEGKPEYYRGVQVETTLLPKVQVDIVVSKIPVRSVIDVAKKYFIQDTSEMVRFLSMM